MPLPAGEDQGRALRPRPANCSPAMIIACGSDSSFSMHSATMRRATRFVDATRGISAIDSIVLSRSTRRRVSRPIISLILHQLFDSCPQFGMTGLGLLHDRGGRVLHELLVGELRLERRELLAALLDLALRALDLLLGDHFRRELDRDREAFHHVVMPVSPPQS